MVKSKARQRLLLRKSLRLQRRQLSGSDRADKSNALITQILRHRLYRQAKHIAFYSAFDGEVDITPLLLHAYNNGKHCYLPVIPSLAGQRMHFVPYLSNALEKTNHFGIREPIYKAHTIFPRTKLDLVLMPLVGFDKRGQRLGMGGGFYDRCFEFRRFRRHWSKPTLLGVAFELQKVDSLVSELWDVTMDACVTETDWYQF
ncbi:MAG: 5-formyltetrahydrofolate cyclo-ligase [Gammaproteobacteria bacterium]|nr:MAG: 5-formyltetrahydrofolate cyclo-ligase [Gammaproteobacteria bacterium]